MTIEVFSMLEDSSVDVGDISPYTCDDNCVDCQTDDDHSVDPE